MASFYAAVDALLLRGNKLYGSSSVRGVGVVGLTASHFFLLVTLVALVTIVSTSLIRHSNLEAHLPLDFAFFSLLASLPSSTISLQPLVTLLHHHHNVTNLPLWMEGVEVEAAVKEDIGMLPGMGEDIVRGYLCEQGTRFGTGLRCRDAFLYQPNYHNHWFASSSSPPSSWVFSACHL